MIKLLIVIAYLGLIAFIIWKFAVPWMDNLAAHPGKTASDGCHFCRTNCESLGYTKDTRHGHNNAVCDPKKGPVDPKYKTSQQEFHYF